MKKIISYLFVLSLVSICGCGGKHPPDHHMPPDHDSLLPVTISPQSNRYAVVEFPNNASPPEKRFYEPLEKVDNGYLGQSTILLPESVIVPIHVEVTLPKMEPQIDFSHYLPTLNIQGYEQKTLSFQNVQLNATSDQVIFSLDLTDVPTAMPYSATYGALEIHFASDIPGEEDSVIEIPFTRTIRN